jgi:hypothetical protein
LALRIFDLQVLQNGTSPSLNFLLLVKDLEDFSFLQLIQIFLLVLDLVVTISEQSIHIFARPSINF